MAEEKVLVEEVVEATEAQEEVKEAAPRREDRPRRSDRRREEEREDSPYESRLVSVGRITKVVKGGRRMRFNALVVIGDGKGLVGFGTGKAHEVPDAIKKATKDAEKNLIKVPLYRTTLPHEVIGHYGSGSVLLKPAVPGTALKRIAARNSASWLA